MFHPYGSFCFAELHTADVDAAKRFYRQLLGWKPIDVVGNDYFLFQTGGENAIAMRRTDGPSALVAYVSVESADDAVARARGLGATVVTPPFNTRGVARTAVLADPEGAVFGVWERRGIDGAGVQNEAGAMWWVELLARDIQAARTFYTRLFGWAFGETQKYGNDLTIFKTGEESVCSALQVDPDWNETPHWNVLFAVDNWDAAVRAATAHGGGRGFSRDVPHAGRFGVISDPGGATFGIMQPLAMT
jgi:uncharacterized protein